MPNIPAREALARLRDGNARFVAGTPAHTAETLHIQRLQSAGGQRPFAIILGCSDSRVPAELVFDQGLGDLFVIRVAGNIVAPSQVGSVEFAAEQFGVRLVVVLGHSECGAIAATIAAVANPGDAHSKNIRAIVDRVQPAVEATQYGGVSRTDGAFAAAVTRTNVRMSADHLRHGSESLERLIQRDGLVVVGAEYSVTTGNVEFFDGVPG